ncbi:hypothetical protein FSP39_014898 [Pinctada imbricata]|uniref:G-protein coupled receptors family 1 profile domain-containing protein n=1 Tax=Pinctada imbricata TaxID=66713 RepID=A0AA88Y077_PINIB|nr:hypothetical protein FSP39_014898 [Pinctada imbricata]
MNNTTKLGDGDLPGIGGWSLYFETSLLAVLCLFGITGNCLVIKTSVTVETKFARQIMTVFCGLAVADILLCNIRIPIFIYSLFRADSDNGHVVCFVWQLSSALVGIIICKNLVVGLQRLMIIQNFPRYKKYFTRKCTIKILIGVWLINWTLTVALSQGLGWHMVYKGHALCKFDSFEANDLYVYRAVVLGLQNGAPLILTGCCHIWIVTCILRTGLTRSQNNDDNSAYVRVNFTAILRTIMLLLCFSPFLVGGMIHPDYNVHDSPYQRYYEYLICLQSVLSPYITLGDSDFKETNKRRSDGNRPGNENGRVGRRPSYITSCDLKTERPTE